ncbi:MAG: cobyrinate a,c-diamide synthase [Firmicutes bacterium]|nr:cobyrinate a,c-diamide synthase [Bacillota bacterium]
MYQNGFVIAAPKSGEGKTTIACGIMAALVRRGMSVQPYKVGPDYVDPAFHRLICKRPSINLDLWMVPEELVRWSFAKRASSAQVAVVEGVMGLFDGSQEAKRSGSTADLARALDLGVILVLDVSKMADSAGALVSGFANYHPEVKIAAVVANKVGSPNHYELVKDAIEGSTGIPVIGGIGRDEHLAIPERKLGLSSPEQFTHFSSWLDRIADLMEKSIDLDYLLALTPQLHLPQVNDLKNVLNLAPQVHTRIAVARDAVFNSYYQDNLDLLSALGGEVVEFSPLRDQTLPANIDGIYLSGRFSRDAAEVLSSNQGMHRALQAACQVGTPILAEGGGLAYLTEGYLEEDSFYPFAQLIPGKVRLTQRLAAMGYRQAFLHKDTILGLAGTELRGHEFHYTSLSEDIWNGVFETFSSKGEALGLTGFMTKNLVASHLHWHFFSNPQALASFLQKAQYYNKRSIGHETFERNNRRYT